MRDLLFKPIFFEPNRVFRVYSGGKLLDWYINGKEGEDGFYPEEWICSSVKALNRDGKGEGVSVVKGREIAFDKLLADYPEELLGGRKNLGVLVKFLDSAIRLPVQAHPDKEFSRKYFDSEYGKTEMWLILATRKDAKVYLGFSRKITKEEFLKAIELSETDKDAMERLLYPIPVKEGEVYLINAKTAHAIGAGCLILEVQEPTDFTIQPEAWCDNYKLNDYEKYLQVKKEDAIDCFNFDAGESAVKSALIEPETVTEEKGLKYQSLISYSHTPCFAVNKITLDGAAWRLKNKPAVFIVTDGGGELVLGDERFKIKKGDYFFLPYCCEGCILTGKISAVECLPPQQAK